MDELLFVAPDFLSADMVVDGVLLVDGRFGRVTQNGKKYWYVNKMMEDLWFNLGFVCVAVCGTAVSGEWSGMIKCAEQALVTRRKCGVHRQPQEVSFAVMIASGTQLYDMLRFQNERPMPTELQYQRCRVEADGMADSWRYAKANLAKRVLLVYGFSSAVWGHSETYSKEYDLCVQCVMDELVDTHGVLAMKGIMLGALELHEGYWIKHIMLPRLSFEYLKWVQWISMRVHGDDAEIVASVARRSADWGP